MLLKSLLIFSLIGIMVNGPIGVQGAAIPIWELLTHEEKVKFENSARVIVDSSSFMILSFVD